LVCISSLNAHVISRYQQPKTDLVLSAFTLGDTPSEALRRSALQSLWDQTGDVLVLIERGTPVGFRIIAQAREWILETNSDHQQQIAHVVAPVRENLNSPHPLFSHAFELSDRHVSIRYVHSVRTTNLVLCFAGSL
jgi:hypothetical protein